MHKFTLSHMLYACIKKKLFKLKYFILFFMYICTHGEQKKTYTRAHTNSWEFSRFAYIIICSKKHI